MGFNSVMLIFGTAQEAAAPGCVVEFSNPGHLFDPRYASWADGNAEIRLRGGSSVAMILILWQNKLPMDYDNLCEQECSGINPGRAPLMRP
jgi:hypothetical protein